MLKHWSKSSKVSCLVLTYASLPRNDNERFPAEDVVGWSARVISKYAAALEVDSNYLSAYEPLLRPAYALPQDTVDMIKPFVQDLTTSGFALQYLMELYIFLVTNGFYDARGRVAIRNCVDILHLPREQYFALELALAHSLHECEEQLARAATAEMNKDSSKVKRYMKIGAAGLGAGAVIAFTGGLAAPAVAAALLVIGGSAAVAAAGFATFTVLASVFGTAGAGLAGYKMARRTKGIDEFEFEQVGDRGQLAVTIMVSGWMDEEEDYKRTFGILPSAMTLEEALTRFYLMHDREKVHTVREETARHEVNPGGLVDHVTASYGLCPLSPANLSPPFTPHLLSEEDQALLERLIRDFVLLSSKGSGAAAARGASAGKAGTAQDATVKAAEENGSISKSAGRFFKGAAKYTSALLPSSKSSSAGSVGSKGPVAAPAPDSLQPIPARDLSGSDVLTCSPTVDVHLLASRAAEPPEAATIPPEEVHEEDPVSAADGPAAQLSAAECSSESGLETQYWNWSELDVAPLYELYLLKWETSTQLEIGTSLRQLMKSLQKAVAEKMLMFTVAGLVMSAVALPYTLLKLTDMIDSTWVIALERADAAGKELAEALLNRPQGSRPVTLVGHSIGARLIFSCLIELSLRQDEFDEAASVAHADRSSASGAEEGRNVKWASVEGDSAPPAAAAALGLLDTKPAADESLPTADNNEKDSKKLSSYGLIQDVVLLGVPVNTSKKSFQCARSVVAGRFVNGFSNKDLCLAFLYRWGAKEAIKVAGLQSVDVLGIENVDLSFMIEKHTDYSTKMKQVLSLIDFGHSSGFVDV